MEFLGYRRPDGSVGIRNWVLLVPFRYEHQIAERIARTVRGTRVLVTTGCLGRPRHDRETFARVIAGLGCNPNVAGTILIGTAPEAEYPEVDYHRLACFDCLFNPLNSFFHTRHLLRLDQFGKLGS